MFAAFKLVRLAPLPDKVVKEPVDGVTLPIGVLSTKPPVIVALALLNVVADKAPVTVVVAEMLRVPVTAVVPARVPLLNIPDSASTLVDTAAAIAENSLSISVPLIIFAVFPEGKESLTVKLVNFV
jgi:hypothetical protein